jgi:ERCC4-type nuclease
MKIIIDEREHELYEKCYSIVNTEGNTTSIQLFKQVLTIGDILIKTDEDKEVLLIERKTFADLLSSIKDGRYEEQSYRLTHSSGFPMHNVIYLLEGMFSQLRSAIEKKIVYSSITSLNYFKGFSVMRTSNIRETAELIVWMACKIEKDMTKGKIPYYQPFERANVSNTIIQDTVESSTTESEIPNYCTVVKKVKKDNITPENIGEIILCQIPGISSHTAIAIMKHFTSFPQFIEEVNKNPEILDSIKMDANGKMRKISKNCVESIKQYLLKPNQSEPSTIV